MANDESFDFSPVPAPGRSKAWLIAVTAVLALGCLLGRNALVSSEGELAECVRLLQSGKDMFAAGNQWMPESVLTVFAARITCFLADFTGVSELILRIPAALAALLLLIGTIKLASRFFDDKTACTAGWLLLGSYGFLYWGRHASWHMLLSAGVIWFAAVATAPERNWRRIFMLSFLTVSGILLGGIAFILAAAPAVLLLPDEEKTQRKISDMLPAGAAMITAVVLVFFLMYSPQRTLPENFLTAGENIIRVFSATFHQMIYPGSSMKWYEAIANLPRLLVPWLPITAAVLIVMFQRFKQLPRIQKKLLICALLMFVLMGIFPGKRWQYQLPMLPFFIILTAVGMTGEYNKTIFNRIADFIMTWVFTLLGSLTAVLAITYPLWDMLMQVTPPLVLMIAVPLMGFIAVGFLVFDTGTNCIEEKLSGMYGPWSGYVLAGVILSIALWCVAIPSLTKFRTGRPFWKKCGEIAGKNPDRLLVFAGSGPAPLERYYMDLPGEFNTAMIKDLPAYIAKSRSDSGYIVATREDTVALQLILTMADWEVSKAAVEGNSLYLLPDKDYGEKKFVLYKFTSKKKVKK